MLGSSPVQLAHMPPHCHPTPFGFIILKPQMGCVLQSSFYKSELSCRFLRLRGVSCSPVFTIPCCPADFCGTAGGVLQSSFYKSELSCRFLRLRVCVLLSSFYKTWHCLSVGTNFSHRVMIIGCFPSLLFRNAPSISPCSAPPRSDNLLGQYLT